MKKELYYNRKEAMDYLKVSQSAFLKIVKNNNIKTYRINGSRLVRYLQQDIHELLK